MGRFCGRRLLKFLTANLAIWATLVSVTAQTEVPTVEPSKWWGGKVDAALERSGDRKSDWTTALLAAADDQRPGWEFLIANMPNKDLAQLPVERLKQTLDLAYQARREVPWGQTLPGEVFLNYVLPYCQLDEPRDPWRRELHDRFMERAKQCHSPGEAALMLNKTIFGELHVKYSTSRKRANQSPRESIDQGVASCTGLSILLADACRAVGVPARLAGIGKWTEQDGNHTWVEVWDDGWHFVGAAEPDPQGLNHAWFQARAARANADSHLNAILAVSYKKTPIHWPLVWDLDDKTVSAVNVTDRYVADAAPDTSADHRLLIDVRDSHSDKRISCVVSATLADDATRRWVGVSMDETQDTNNILEWSVAPSARLQVVARLGLYEVTQTVVVDQPLTRVTLKLRSENQLTDEQQQGVTEFATAWFDRSQTDRSEPVPASLIASHELDVTSLVWSAYCEREREQWRADVEKHVVHLDGTESPYTVKEVGQAGPNGWPLVIAMHGGGNAPKEVNDSQWRHMQIYYRDQAQVAGYKYLALRAPNDTWNGFYYDAIYPLIHQLIRQQVVCGNVDVNRVYLIGYSHGGYGAFAIGPKMPDHFAAIHSSAAAPTDNESVPDTLQNTRFTFMIGAKDVSYGRAERCQKFSDAIEGLRGDRRDIFPVTMLWEPDHGHVGLPDREFIDQLYRSTRNATPKSLRWLMSDSVIRDHFWLMCDQPQKQWKITAECQDNQITIQSTAETPFRLGLNSRLVDLTQPVKICLEEATHQLQLQPSVRTICESIERRSDPYLSYSATWESP